MDIVHLRPTRVEIDLDNLEYNMNQIKSILSPSAKICAVLKADGYGHGAVEIAQEIMGCGAAYIAVSFIDEALELRQSGVKVPILILGFTPESQFDKIIEYDITQTIYNTSSAETLSKLALKYNKKAKVHIKIDTGMNRIGFQANSNSLTKIASLFSLEGLEIEGIYTHFAKADEKDKTFTKEQYKSFNEMANRLKQMGHDIPIKHVANSATVIDLPDMHLDMVRPGLILYGLYPSQEVQKDKLDLKPLMSLKTKVSHVKKVDRGRRISYGGTFVTKRESLIATLPVGYADGYSRLLSSKADVLIKGQRAPVVGRICMDQCMVDITDIKDKVQTGEDVVLFGKMGNKEILADELAHTIGTINYEIICGVSRRVPRVYIRHGKIIKVKNLLVY